MFGALTLAWGCATELPAAPERVWPVENLVIELNGPEPVALSLSGAVVLPNGDGHGVNATAAVQTKPSLTVVGKSSRWELAQGIVLFEGDVVAERGDVTLYCDRLELKWVDDVMDSAVAMGNVRVVRGDRVAFGARAHLTVADGRISLTGGPRVQDGLNVLTGQRVVLFLDDERLECDDCRLEVAGEPLSPR